MNTCRMNICLVVLLVWIFCPYTQSKAVESTEATTHVPTTVTPATSANTTAAAAAAATAATEEEETIITTTTVSIKKAPGKVQDLSVLKISGIYTKVNVTWACPREKERNGLITKYVLKYTADQQRRSVLESSNGMTIVQHLCNSSLHKVTEITPEINYTFTVKAFTIYEGQKSTVTFYTQPGKPPSLNTIVLFGIPTAPKHHGPNETRFIVDFCASCLTNKTIGIVIFVGMIICKTGAICADKVTSRTDRSLDRVIFDPHVCDHIRFEVGSGKECQKKPGEYCNGPLDSDSQYSVKFISCTRGGCTQSDFQEGFVTKAPESNIGVYIVGALGGTELAGLIIFGAWYYKRRNRKRKEFENDDDSDEEDAVDLTRPIKMLEFSTRLEGLHKDSHLLFAREFAEIQSNSPKRSCEIACLESNRVKNRYVNILAFDHSLVKLMPRKEEVNSGYINANFIPGYNSPREYIATQGPVDLTVKDLWRMVWERKVPIIVMLTGVKEGTKQKCAKYWPDELQVQRQYGDLMVMLDHISTLKTYTLKIFKINLGRTERTVKHFFMHDWRDYDANLDPTDVANFVCDIRRERRQSEPGPMIVHCSSGGGRTGTFIAIDYFMQFINDHDLQKNIDIFQFVLKMRENRPHMVQDEKQYIFIHETVKMLIQQKMLHDKGQ